MAFPRSPAVCQNRHRSPRTFLLYRERCTRWRAINFFVRPSRAKSPLYVQVRHLIRLPKEGWRGLHSPYRENLQQVESIDRAPRSAKTIRAYPWPATRTGSQLGRSMVGNTPSRVILVGSFRLRAIG